jgi:hypothetical protein
LAEKIPNISKEIRESLNLTHIPYSRKVSINQEVGIPKEIEPSGNRGLFSFF